MTSSPYADFLEQPDIKYYGGSEPSKCLLAMSKTLCELLVKYRIKSKGSRHIELPGNPSDIAPLVKQTSDLTTGIKDSSDHVEKMARQPETGERIGELRKDAQLQNIGSKINDEKKALLVKFIDNEKLDTGSSLKSASDMSSIERKTLSPSAFKKKYTWDSIDSPMVAQIKQKSRLQRQESEGEILSAKRKETPDFFTDLAEGEKDIVEEWAC